MSKIILKAFLDQRECDDINKLQSVCQEFEPVSFKLEIEFKHSQIKPESVQTVIELDDLGADFEKAMGDVGQLKLYEYLFYEGGTLLGYIGACDFGGVPDQLEVNGLVHPEYRNRGIFKTLYACLNTWYAQSAYKSMLLLCDRQSKYGQMMIQKIGAAYKHTEYEMYLDFDAFDKARAFLKNGSESLSYRTANNADAKEIARQNRIFFKEEFELDLEAEDNDEYLLPEKAQEEGMTILMVEKDGESVGKTQIQLFSEEGGIYGLGVLTKYRGLGYGRAILMKSVDCLIEKGASSILLQVEAKNENALRLYQSAGFKQTSTMDYFKSEN